LLLLLPFCCCADFLFVLHDAAAAAAFLAVQAQIMFVSESGICRGPLAAALFRHMVVESPLRDWIEVTAKVRLQLYVGCRHNAHFRALCSDVHTAAEA
jgi:hypothetical protein